MTCADATLCASPLTRRQALAATFGAGLAVGMGQSAQAEPFAGTSARALPPELEAFASAGAPWRLQGSGTLRFFGFKAYDAWLWTQGGSGNPLLNNQPFALEIEYSTSVRAEEIVNVSLVEMARLSHLREDQVKAWTLEMQRSFPSVSSGDRFLGLQLPSAGTRFFFNGGLISQVGDLAFGNAFFAIWLDERTKRPDLRRELLGIAPPAPPRPPRGNG